MKRKTFKRTLLALSLALPLAAFARDAIVVDSIDLQAGPDPDYPSITQLSAGTEVQVQGCIDGYNWCDVLAAGDRGWVPGTFLAEEYDGDRVLIVDAGPRIGIPVVSFEIGAYWGEHYHNRPFYAQRETFVSRHITPHAPQRPSEVALNRVNVHVTAGGGGHEHEGGTATRENAQAGTTSRSDARAQSTRNTATTGGAAVSGSASVNQTDAQSKDARTHERAQQTRNTASSTNASGNSQQHAMTHNAPPPAQSTPQAQEQSRATAETRDNERNVPNTRNDQRDAAHGMTHTMPPTVQGGNGQHQVATNKSSSQQQNGQERKQEAKPQPKSDKDKGKDESNKDHDHQ